MMWDYGMNVGWMWLWGLLFFVGLALLVLVAVLLSGGGGRGGQQGGPGTYPGPHPGPSRARQILDERFARGELNAEQYRESLRVLGEDT